MLTRRYFIALATAAATVSVRAQTRLNVAEIDRNRILTAAAQALKRPDLEGVAALAAANQIDPAQSEAYTARAALLLHSALLPLPTAADEAEIVARTKLAELAVSLSFLLLPEDALKPAKLWFKSYLAFLGEDRGALLVRDAKDHRGSTHLLQSAAAARLLGDDTALAAQRHFFRHTTLRAQINAEGFFPHELTSATPFRNSLFNLDLLAGVCQVLSTRFESVWDYELPDGPGVRAAIARHAIYIADRSIWPYPADSTLFHQLPGRRPALLLAARAFNQADYATLWRSLPAELSPELLTTFPIRQPLLWLSQPRRS